MKTIVLAASVLAITASAASAADLAARPYSKAPVAPAGYDWSGFYIGINGGYGSAATRWTLTNGLPDSAFSAAGGVVGGQFGWRTQAGSLVWGFDLQGDWADLNGSQASGAFPGLANIARVDDFGILAATAGWALNNVLLYAKGGGAFTGNTFSGTGQFIDSAKETRWGAALGVGLEYGLTPNWTIGIEYDHLFMGTVSDAFNHPNGTFSGDENVRQDVDLVTARINYKFGGPIVARY